jgi:hypothetical protein
MKKSISIWTARLIATLTVLTLAGGSAMAAPAAHHGPIVRLRHGTSSNWSGYAAYNGTFNSVSANWTQPAVSCTSAAAYSSYWVGLDGYNSNSVEQLGTEGDCSGGAPSYYAWYEMYPHRSFSINMTISPNDSMSASVTYANGGKFTLRLVNNSTGRSFATTQRMNNAARSSAEAIVEAPYSGGTLPLANFGTANFSNTLANGSPIGNYTVDPITMVNPAGMKATPSPLDSTKAAFSVSWSAS